VGKAGACVQRDARASATRLRIGAASVSETLERATEPHVLAQQCRSRRPGATVDETMTEFGDGDSACISHSLARPAGERVKDSVVDPHAGHPAPPLQFREDIGSEFRGDGSRASQSPLTLSSTRAAAFTVAQ
jgi:hypothetical protein